MTGAGVTLQPEKKKTQKGRIKRAEVMRMCVRLLTGDKVLSGVSEP